MRYKVRTIGSGPSGTRQTLHVMAELTNAAQLEPITRHTALQILGLNRTPAEFAESVRHWVRRHMTLVDEPVEMISRPEWMLAHRGRRRLVGDCDDAAVLAGTLILALGIPVRYVAVGAPGEPYSHVFPEAHVNGRWESYDPTSNYAAPPDWHRMEQEVL